MTMTIILRVTLVQEQQQDGGDIDDDDDDVRHDDDDDDDDDIDGDLGVGVVAGGSMQVKPSLSNIRPI